MKIAKQAFDFLPGIWKIARNVVSQTTSEVLQKANGYGAFIVSKDDPNCILYSEKVTVHNLELNTTYIGTQKYQYKYDKTTSAITKYFGDGRFFYTLNMSNDKVAGEHLCINDKYKSSYVFEENKFTLTYSITGPSKCYDILTEYTKVSTEDEATLGITIENGEII